MDKTARTTRRQHLQSLWRKHDVTSIMVRCLDLKAISRLPTISRSFNADHPRLLVSLVRGNPGARRGFMDALANDGHDSFSVCERWENGLANWERLESLCFNCATILR